MRVSELNDGRRGGVCGGRATSVAGEARGRGRAFVRDGRERGVAIRVVLCDTEAAGAAAKETWKN